MPSVTIPVGLLAQNLVYMLEGNTFSPETIEAALRRSLQGVAAVDIGARVPIVESMPPEQHKVVHPVMDAQVGGGHYKDHPIQHVEYCQKNKIPWCESAAIKYLVRHSKKNKVEDVDKAIHYCLLLRALEYPEASPFTLKKPQ